MIESERRPRPGAGVFVLLPLVALLFMIGCGDSGGTEPVAEPWFPDDYEASYDEVFFCRGSGAHQNSARIFVSDGLGGDYEAARNGTDITFPIGTVILKVESLDCDGGAIARQTVMRKRTGGDSPDLSDWEWQEVDAFGEVSREGAITECINCHAGCDPGWDYTCFDPAG